MRHARGAPVTTESSPVKPATELPNRREVAPFAPCASEPHSSLDDVDPARQLYQRALEDAVVDGLVEPCDVCADDVIRDLVTRECLKFAPSLIGFGASRPEDDSV